MNVGAWTGSFNYVHENLQNVVNWVIMHEGVKQREKERERERERERGWDRVRKRKRESKVWVWISIG